jgi:Fe-S cluster biogenesis protein NfuA/nitrite reductase/ring-hydroxylating ferredoxin subunit
MSEKKDFQQHLQKIEDLVNTIEASADPNVRKSAIELMQCLMDLNATGIERIMNIAYESSPNGGEIIDKIADDEMAESLLFLYGLHPLDIETRVMKALDKVRPYLQSHKGNVDLLNIKDGFVRLKLQGSCDGCASSAMTLKLAIEEAIYEFAPDIAGLQVEGVVEEKKASQFVQIEPSTKNGVINDEGWKEVSGLISLADGAVTSIEISKRPIIFCRIGETFYAYNDTCPECGNTMQNSSMNKSALICASCQGRFDVMRAGRGLDKPNLYLEPFPLLVEQGHAKIALPSI